MFFFAELFIAEESGILQIKKEKMFEVPPQEM